MDEELLKMAFAKIVQLAKYQMMIVVAVKIVTMQMKLLA